MQRVRQVPYEHDTAFRHRCFQDGVGTRRGLSAFLPTLPPSLFPSFLSSLLLALVLPSLALFSS